MKKDEQINSSGDNGLTDDIFVVKHKKEFRILTTNSEKAIKVFDNKRAALRFASILQSKKKTSIYVMDDNGRLVDLHPYINPSKVKEIIISESDTSEKKLEALPKVATAISC